MSEKDTVLESLLETAKSKKIDLPDKFLKQIYNIEKEHQYRDKSDRGIAYREIKNAVDKYITSTKT